MIGVLGSGGQGNSLQSSSSAAQDVSNTFSTGAKTVNFGAPIKPALPSAAGIPAPVMYGVLGLLALIGLAVVVKKK